MTLAAKAAMLAMAFLSFAAFPAAASADDGQVEINIGQGWQHDTQRPLFSVDQVDPGWQQSRTLEVRNDSEAPANLAIESTNITERENGCVHGEEQVDPTCGTDQGELGRDLRFSIFDDHQGDGQPLWTGTLYDLAHPVSIIRDLGAHDVTTIRLVAELPSSTGDEVETDQVGFGFRLVMQAEPPSVLGETIHRAGVDSGNIQGAVLPRPGGLPFTGSWAIAEALVGVALLVGGSLLVQISRRGSQSVS